MSQAFLYIFCSLLHSTYVLLIIYWDQKVQRLAFLMNLISFVTPSHLQSTLILKLGASASTSTVAELDQVVFIATSSLLDALLKQCPLKTFLQDAFIVLSPYSWCNMCMVSFSNFSKHWQFFIFAHCFSNPHICFWRMQMATIDCQALWE